MHILCTRTKLIVEYVYCVSIAVYVLAGFIVPTTSFDHLIQVFDKVDIKIGQ